LNEKNYEQDKKSFNTFTDSLSDEQLSSAFLVLKEKFMHSEDKYHFNEELSDHFIDIIGQLYNSYTEH